MAVSREKLARSVGVISDQQEIANGLGIPHDPVMVKATKDIREQLGLNSFLSAINTLKYFPSD
jgi:hypothetical protein